MSIDAIGLADPVAKTELAKYRAVWAIDAYRVKCHGLDLWRAHREVFPDVVISALDIGCGTGRLFAAMNCERIDAHGVDFAPNCLDAAARAGWPHKFHLACLWDMELRREFELGVCADVMEHIPAERIDATLDRIAAHCYVVLFAIANYPSNSLGHELHPSLHGAAWWQATIASRGGQVERLDIARSAREVYFYRWRPGA